MKKRSPLSAASKYDADEASWHRIRGTWMDEGYAGNASRTTDKDDFVDEIYRLWNSRRIFRRVRGLSKVQSRHE